MMASKAKQRRVMTHDEFIDRIRKSLYFGSNTLDEDMQISRPLAELSSELFSEPHKGHSLDRLSYVAVGNVHATPCSLIMALIYLDRLNVCDPGYARLISPQELFIVSMMISTKFFAGHDEEIYLGDWAEDGNMTEERLKQLELEFLSAIGWNIYISNEQFFNKLNIIEKTLAQREGLRRGWLTYSELMHMLPSFTLAKFLLNNITVMAVSYAFYSMTIAGAFFLVSQIPGNAFHRKTNTSTGDLLSHDTILPMNNTQLHGKQAKLLLNSGDEKNTTFCDVSSTMSHTANCAALNVETELLKLERQYREEAALEALRKRNSEIKSDSRLTLAMATEYWLNIVNHKAYIRNTQRNWFALKEEYSDKKPLQHRIHDQSFTASIKSQITIISLIENRYPCINDMKNILNNGTSFMFWHLLANAGEQARLPFMWLKFI